jgi:predicted ATPase/DNA-binding CsgD family transcriptional regulator
LKVLVTSRTLLRIYGEHEFVIGTLTYPDSSLTSPQALLEYGAIALLVQRIRAVRVDFCLTQENAATVARICRHLDGLPLALELAAARCKVLSPQELLARLESASDYNTLRLLNNGSRDLPQRHQTLRTNLDWSYALLDECEKILLARLAVFSASFSLEAVETICSAKLTDAEFCCDLLDCLGALLDKSMLGKTESTGGTVRFIMLNTVKEYALEKLAERGELEIMRQRHAKYYLKMVKKAGYEWSVTEQTNLQAARHWLGLNELEESLTEQATVKEALQLDELSAHEVAIRAGKVKPVEVPAHSYSLNKTRPTLPNGLTRREVEVLRLVTQGLTNVQVAEKLVLAPRTVNVHLTSIYSKLGVNSRTAAARFAFDQNLI